MKKNIIFSIALCIGLLLPGTNLATEPLTWSEWLTQGFLRSAQALYAYAVPSLQNLTSWTADLANSIDKQKLAWYGIWTALGFGGYTALNYRAKRIQILREKRQKKIEQIAKKYDLHSLLEKRIIDKDNFHNIGIFLSSKSLRKEEMSQTIFNQYVYPTLRGLIISKPQRYNFTNYKGSESHKQAFQKSMDTFYQKEITDYYKKNKDQWSLFIDRARESLEQQKHPISLTGNTYDYLRTIQPYLQDKDPLKESITDALTH